jgi:hypothetical protein
VRRRRDNELAIVTPDEANISLMTKPQRLDKEQAAAPSLQPGGRPSQADSQRVRGAHGQCKGQDER